MRGSSAIGLKGSKTGGASYEERCPRLHNDTGQGNGLLSKGPRQGSWGHILEAVGWP